MDGIRLWLEKQLAPPAKALLSHYPDALSWAGLLLSLSAAGLLYCASDRPWMAVLAVPLIMARLGLDSTSSTFHLDCGESEQRRGPNEVLSDLSDRLSDVAIFLSFAFWPDFKMHLVLLAVIAMLLVSYVGVLGQAAGAKRQRGGVFGKAQRMILLMVTCLFYGLFPNVQLFDFSIFEMMFVLFIPLSSVALLQRLDAALGPD